MGRLVVAAHLPYHGLAVLHVVPQGVVAPRRGVGGREDAELVVTGAHDDLLAPVAKDIALIRRRALGVVIGHRPCQSLDQAPAIFVDTTGSVLAVRIVEALLEQVAVPVDAHVVGQTRFGEASDVVVGHAADGLVVRRESHGAGEIVGEVSCHAATVVAAACPTVIDLAGGGVTIVVGGVVLIAGKNLVTMDVWIEIAMVLGITMSKPGSRQSLAIIVDDHRTETNLVASVPVDIGHGIVMVSVAIPLAARRVAVPAPARGEFMSGGIYVQGYHLVAGVDASGQEDAGLAAIEIGSAEEMLGRAVAVAVAPCGVQVGLSGFESLQRIIHRHVGHAGLTIHIHQVFSTLVHEPVGPTASSATIVLRFVANDIILTVGGMNHRTVGGTHQGLSLAVAIPVVSHDVVLVVLEVAHVGTEIQPP